MSVQTLRLGRLILIVIVAIAALIALGIATLKIGSHPLVLRTYMEDGYNIRPNALVQVAGINVGCVSSVVVHPGHGPQTVEIVMDINTPYDLKVPKDAVTELQTAGVLGETFVNIKVQNAIGAPVENGGVLASGPAANGTAPLKQLRDALTEGCVPTNSPQATPTQSSSNKAVGQRS